MALSDFFSGAWNVVNSPIVKDVAIPGAVSYYNQQQLKDSIGQAGQQVQQGLTRGLGALESQYAYGAGQLEPYQYFGLEGLEGYQGLLNDPSQITSNPGYDFRFGEGQRAVERSAAAKGMGLSGNTLAGLTQYGQQFAMDEYDRALARRAAQIATGLRGAGTLADLSEAYGRGVAGLYGEQGSTAGATTIGQAQAQRGGLQDILDIYQGYRQAKTVAGGNSGGSNLPGLKQAGDLYTSTVGALPYLGSSTGLSAIGPGSQAGMLALQDAGLQGAQQLTLEALGSGVGQTASAGSSAAAAGGTIGPLGALGIGAGILGVGKLTQALTADKDRVAQLQQRFQQSPQQGYDFLEGIVTGKQLDNNRLETRKPIKWALESGITDFSAPMWHGKDARFNIWSDETFENKGTKTDLEEAYSGKLSTIEQEEFAPYLYGSTPQESQKISQLLTEKNRLESKVDVSDSPTSPIVRMNKQKLADVENQLSQYVNPQRKRQRAQEIYNQLKGKGYDLTKLENYLGVK